ncbi:methyltransferase [Klugiella xanthotipulae]|uniref:Methyltransferase family protein n=1 Tax=Klugiella xanthotipulae TaxID=244735 RepID=A0A543HSC8_9MICO|nr:methyltransferase [Klugiella xanthotipulae]TQM61248.1 methyltransferase family protein [Klugiella xanthotipulae]
MSEFPDSYHLPVPDLPVSISEALNNLADDFRAAGYTAEGLVDLLGEAWPAVQRSQGVPARRRLASRRRQGLNTSLDTLVALFVLGQKVPFADAEAALSGVTLPGALDIHLVRVDVDHGMVAPLLDARPQVFTDPQGTVEWIILSDQGELSRGDELAGDYVLGVGGATRTLASCAVTDRVDSVLDLGTGCGVLAMLATRYARRVVATDISERALRIAQMNCALNGVTEVEFRRGSLFEPVTGELFDRVVSNPPFVITPRADGAPIYEYRDGGMVGDALVRAVATGVSSVLKPGGVAQLLANWEYRRGEPDLGPVLTWLKGTVSDVWAVERERQSCEDYAETWIRDGGVLPRTPRFDDLYDLWLHDFEERGITEVGFGYVLVARPAESEFAAAPLRRLERCSGPLGHNPLGLGRHVAESLMATRLLAGLSDSELARQRCVVASDVTEHRHYLPGEDHPAVIQLVQGGGFGRTVAADTALAACVGACDGELTVGAIASALADLLSADERELGLALFPRVRELIRDGFLEIDREP